MSRKKKGPRRPGPAVTPPPVSVPTPPPARKPLPSPLPNRLTFDQVTDRLLTDQHRTAAPRGPWLTVLRWLAVAALVAGSGFAAWYLTSTGLR